MKDPRSIGFLCKGQLRLVMKAKLFFKLYFLLIGLVIIRKLCPFSTVTNIFCLRLGFEV